MTNKLFLLKDYFFYLYKKVFKGLFWSFIASFFSQLFTLIGILIIARFIGVKAFGEYGIIITTVNLVTGFAGFGTSVTNAKFISEFKFSDKKRTAKIISFSFIINIIFGLTFSGILYILSPLIVNEILNANEILELFQMSCVIIFFISIFNVQIGTLIGLENFKLIAYFNFFRGVISLPLVVVGVILYGLFGVIIANIISIILCCIINEIFLIKEYKKYEIEVNYKTWWDEHKLITAFNLPAFLSNVFYGFALWITYSLLINQTNGFIELGIYNAARYWQIALVFIPGLLSQVMIPFLSEKAGTNNIKGILTTIKDMSLILFILIMPVGLILICLSPFIMQQYGMDFINGWPILVICIITGMIQSFISLFYPFIVSINKMWFNFQLTIIWVFILLLTFFFLLDKGALGLSFSILVSYIFQGIILILFLINFKKKLYEKTDTKILLSGQ